MFWCLLLTLHQGSNHVQQLHLWLPSFLPPQLQECNKRTFWESNSYCTTQGRFGIIILINFLSREDVYELIFLVHTMQLVILLSLTGLTWICYCWGEQYIKHIMSLLCYERKIATKWASYSKGGTPPNLQENCPWKYQTHTFMTS